MDKKERDKDPGQQRCRSKPTKGSNLIEPIRMTSQQWSNTYARRLVLVGPVVGPLLDFHIELKKKSSVCCLYSYSMHTGGTREEQIGVFASDIFDGKWTFRRSKRIVVLIKTE